MIESKSLPTRYQTAFTNGEQSALASCPVRKTLSQPLSFAAQPD